MKRRTMLISLLLMCIMLLSISSSYALSQNVSEKRTAQGVSVNMKGTQQKNNDGTVSPYTGGFVGTAGFRCIAIGSMLMDADWTLKSTAGPITFVNVNIWFDNGDIHTDAYPCFGANQYGSAQTEFDTTGYHDASFLASGTINLITDFEAGPITQGDYVY